ncbi:MAG: family 43 glycosylhydrolase, partial [Porcipelethomonas sp.]
GIDPSLYFEDGHAYFISNGCDDNGVSGIVQCEINIETGEKLSDSRTIWSGSGGRYLESPHMYKINGRYYLMAAEGGTEYGHMITYAVSDSVWGEFKGYPGNPVLTNRNKAPGIIQGIGHGDLIEDKYGDWHIICLGFRQTDLWMPYHNLGREVFMIPVEFDSNGWFTAGNDGTADEAYEIKGEFVQEEKREYTFENTDFNIDWCFMRHPDMSRYEFSENKVILHGSDVTLEETDSPTFLGLRQRDFFFELSSELCLDAGEAGITVYMCENEHYDIALRKTETGFETVLKLNIGGIKHVQNAALAESGHVKLIVRADNYNYNFFADGGSGEVYLGSGQAKYLSSEVSGGFTGVLTALYAVGENTAEFTDFRCIYK